jgi:hypothetical protein
MSLDPKIISAAAYLIHGEALRAHRNWDQQGIQATVRGALEDDGRDVLSVIRAGFEAVSDANANTPGAIRWPDRYRAVKGSQDWMNNFGPECTTCGRAKSHHDAAEATVPVDMRHQFSDPASDLAKSSRPHASAAEVAR